ncbi:hypothetical protein [Cribrihabitans marinus]|uniref:hypothetical protein n=1 Tax=Cribrihabitans marinus TaxID=1227549 RepID=UPI00115FDBE1|nr:hypothetical protein [Cribrihabitans marinus]GGH24384.1 hypothetical protein GCM10010973_10870 [Cribrihabitans marinus]
MANYAVISRTPVDYLPVAHEVQRVLVVDNELLLDEGGVEQSQRGVDWLKWLLNVDAVQTSYTSSIRHRYASPGMLYYDQLDIFIEARPYPSWTLDASGNWQPPMPMPDDGKEYEWNEETNSWI